MTKSQKIKSQRRKKQSKKHHKKSKRKQSGSGILEFIRKRNAMKGLTPKQKEYARKIKSKQIKEIKRQYNNAMKTSSLQASWHTQLRGLEESKPDAHSFAKSLAEKH